MVGRPRTVKGEFPARFGANSTPFVPGRGTCGIGLTSDALSGLVVPVPG